MYIRHSIIIQKVLYFKDFFVCIIIRYSVFSDIPLCKFAESCYIDKNTIVAQTTVRTLGVPHN